MNKSLLLGCCIAGAFIASEASAQKVQSKMTDENGFASFIKFDRAVGQASYRSTPQGAEDLFKAHVYATADDRLAKVKSESDAIGFVHEKYQQYYKGYKVEFGDYITHSKDGVIESANGSFKNMRNTNMALNLSEATALKFALAHVNADIYMWESDASYAPKAEKVIINGQLSYKFDIYAEAPVSRAFIYVSAQDGKVLFENKTIKHAVNATAATRYAGTQTIQTGTTTGGYNLRDNSRGLGVETYNMKTGTNYTTAVDFVDADNNWTATEWNNATKDNAALDAHFGAQKTYDYWMSVHGRNSFDGAGAKIMSYVHYSKSYDNAYWDGTRMTYGDGSGVGGFNALTSMDVAGHEIGHAVCEKTANLVYSNESGAMNEGFSDIWGACIESYGKYAGVVNTQTWLIGEDIEMRTGHASLRSMSNPNVEAQPDTYQGTYWYTGTADNGGVHTNSGVLNHWFYRLATGGSGTNDKGYVFNVTGVGISDAAKIAYRLESVYLTSSSTYANAATYGAQAASDLFGATSAQYLATVEAFKAVGLTPGTVVVPGPTTDNCTTTTGLSAARRAWKHYTVVVPAGATKLTGTTTGANGDADLYIRYNAKPTTTTYTAIGGTATSNETASVSTPTAGTWYVSVYAYAAYSALTLKICTTVPAAFGSTAGDVQVTLEGQEVTGSQYIYPNPAASELNIELGETDSKVEIVSLTGQVMKTYTNNESTLLTMDIADLRSGVYLVVVSDHKGKSTQRFIKQ